MRALQYAVPDTASSYLHTAAIGVAVGICGSSCGDSVVEGLLTGSAGAAVAAATFGYLAHVSRITKPTASTRRAIGLLHLVSSDTPRECRATSATLLCGLGPALRHSVNDVVREELPEQMISVLQRLQSA